jgi:AcrR family transcriptional regulator
MCAVCVRIGEALTTLLAQRRLKQVNLAEVAEEAEISQEQLSRHVHTREDALLCAYAAGAERILDCAGGAFEGAPTWHAGVRHMVEEILRDLRRRPGLDRVYYEEAPKSADFRMWEERDRVRRCFVELMLSHHEPDDLPELRFEMLAGALFNVIREQVLVGAHRDDPEAAAAGICEVVPVFEPDPVAA